MVLLIEQFKKYADLKVLACFLSHPYTAYYKKELSRKLGMSPSAVVRAVESFEREGILRMETKGREHFFSLNTESPIVLPLKKAYGLALILNTRPVEAFLEADPGIISLALYGSYARGDFDEQSDIDLLVITHSDKIKLLPALHIVEEQLGIEVNLSTFRVTDWKKMADSGDAYYKNVVHDHIMLHGSDIKWS